MSGRLKTHASLGLPRHTHHGRRCWSHELIDVAFRWERCHPHGLGNR